MQLFEYGVFGGFEGEDVKMLCSNPQKALPCMDTRLLVYRVQNRFNGLSSRSVERFCVLATLAIWGEETPGEMLTKCGVWGDMVDVITYAIFGDCRLKGVDVARGVTLPSPIDLRCRRYNIGHTTV